MTHRFSKCALMAGCAFSLVACGAHDGDGAHGDGVREGEALEQWTEESLEGSLSEAEVAVDVANLEIHAVHPPHVDNGPIHYQSMTLWRADANHKLEAGVRLWKYTGGAWVVVSPWRNATGGKPYQNVWANGYSGCVPGTYRGQGRGRVLFSGGWSPYEYLMGGSAHVACPNPPQ
jgi:hypothetical protein